MSLMFCKIHVAKDHCKKFRLESTSSRITSSVLGYLVTCWSSYQILCQSGPNFFGRTKVNDAVYYFWNDLLVSVRSGRARTFLFRGRSVQFDK